MQKHCIANTTFLFRGLCILGKSSSDIHAPWGIIVKKPPCKYLQSGFRVLPLGIEPGPSEPESEILSFKLREHI